MSLSRQSVAPEWKALLSREPLHFEHTVQDEAAGLPWAKAKIQARLSHRLSCPVPCYTGVDAGLHDAAETHDLLLQEAAWARTDVMAHHSHASCLINRFCRRVWYWLCMATC